MRDLFSLTEYQLRAIRKPLCWMLAIMGPLQFLWAAASLYWTSSTSTGEGYVTPELLMTGTAGMLIPAAFIVAAALVNFSVTVKQNGRSKSIYTLMTLPVKRWKVYASGVLSGVIAVYAVMAAEAIWTMLLYLPLCAVSGWMERMAVTSSMAAAAARMDEVLPGLLDWQAASPYLKNGLFLSMVRAGWMRLLMPLKPLKALLLAAHIFAGVSCLHATMMRRGLMQLLHGILLACSVLLCLWALTKQLLIFMGLDHIDWLSMEPAILAIQLALGALAWLSAVKSLARAENL